MHAARELGTGTSGSEQQEILQAVLGKQAQSSRLQDIRSYR